MASQHGLPTVAEVFTGAAAELGKAYTALGDAADWLRSDWRPLGSPLTGAQAAARTAVFRQVDAAKRAINTARDAIESARSRELDRPRARSGADRAAADDGSEATL